MRAKQELISKNSFSEYLNSGHNQEAKSKRKSLEDYPNENQDQSVDRHRVDKIKQEKYENRSDNEESDDIEEIILTQIKSH